MKQKECMEELLNQQRNEQISSLELSLDVSFLSLVFFK